MERLRQATADIHQRVEESPYATALLGGTLPLESYIVHLRTLAVIHAELERALATSDHPAVGAVWNDELRKLPLLWRDLEHFEPLLVPDVDEAVDTALCTASRIRLYGLQEPLKLLGFLYVLEGSTNGAALLRPELAAHLGLTPEQPGLLYLSNYGDAAAGHWAAFGQTLNAAVTDPAEQDAVAAGAVELFEALEKAFRTFHPLNGRSRSFHATSFNPEAGTHPVVQQPDEIRAALASGWWCLREYRYFELRYAERGRRFTASDSVWLAAICQDMDDAAWLAQVEWLAGVLTGRGMPSVTLKRHLELLYLELARTVPDKADYWPKLLAAAQMLDEKRRTVMDDAALTARMRELDDTIQRPSAMSSEEAVELLAWAEADAASGLGGSAEVLREWLAGAAAWS